jgi:hypothetical protein
LKGLALVGIIAGLFVAVFGILLIMVIAFAAPGALIPVGLAALGVIWRFRAYRRENPEHPDATYLSSAKGVVERKSRLAAAGS